MCYDMPEVTLHNIYGILLIKGGPLHNQKCVFGKVLSLRI